MQAIEVNDLTKKFADFVAVDNISFQVSQGEVFGFLGPNGVGKTTTIRMLTGLSRATSGSCRVLGEVMNPDNKGIRHKIGVVFEEANLYTKLSGRKNLSFFASLYGASKDRVDELLDKYQLTKAKHKQVAHYSKGMKQRLLICRALLNDPELLILDEPTSGLDLASVELIRSFVKEFSAQGKTVLLSTHSMEEADELCHRVAFINHGRIIAVDNPANLKLKYGREYLQVDIVPSVAWEQFSSVVEDLDVHIEHNDDRMEVSITLPLHQGNLGGLIDKLQSVGSIVRVHSQEASLREVFKAVMQG